MRLDKVALLIVLAFFISVNFCETAKRRSSSSKNRRSSRSRATGSVSGSERKTSLGITKNTPIKATSRQTPVIVSQTTRGSRSVDNILFVYITRKYELDNAPVYSHGYPMFSRSVVIPEERAVRIIETETKVLDNDGNVCLNGTSEQESKRKIPEGARKNVTKATTTIQYGNEKKLEFDGTINQEKERVDFKIVSTTKYNTTLVKDENCFVVEERVNGTVIHLYETNPNGASAVAMNAWLSLLTLLVGFFSSRRP